MFFTKSRGVPVGGHPAAGLLLGALAVGLAVSAAAGARSVLSVRLPAGADWRDVAYLAAVPAMTVADGGEPAVVALPPAGELPPEVADFLRRYRPERYYHLGPGREESAWPGGGEHLRADSAVAAGVVLARRFWKASADVVLCGAEDYASALVAAPLAARLKAPLLPVGRGGLSPATLAAARALRARRAVLIGRLGAVGDVLKKANLAVVALADGKAVLAWARKAKPGTDYLAVVNPADRTETAVKKLSLAGALLAAGRGGLVVPLPFAVRWKVGFSGTDVTKEPPAGVKAVGKARLRRGEIALDGEKVAFVAAAEPRDRNSRLYLDRNGNGRFDDAGEGPLFTCDRVTLAGREYIVSLGRKNGAGEADVRLTWPGIETVTAELRGCYEALGRAPEHLCLVGYPDTVPMAIISNGRGKPTDLISDFPYANADGDRFVEIGVARLIAEEAWVATLYASRALNYRHLLDGPWTVSVGQARWENTYTPLFRNVGFRRFYRHDRDDLRWLVKPAEGVKGRRARELDANSPLTGVAAMTHMAHSWWKDLGQTFTWDSHVLLAPTLVESGGCLTAALDRQADGRSVVARLLRNGAVGFQGNARPGIAHQELQRLEFWNGVLLAGETIGQAHRRALNSTVLTVLTDGQWEQGSHRYQMYIRTLFGDPALRIHVPGRPEAAPARTVVKGDTVTVYPPAAWWPVKMRVPEDWKLWADKPLYVCRGAGTYALRSWCGEQYDREITCFTAELRTGRKVKAIHQVTRAPRPLGWTGRYYADEHADGTRTYRWRVQLIDFDQKTGRITRKVDRLEYRIEWAPEG